MWMRGYTNQSSSNTTTTPADNNNGCVAIDQYNNPMSMIMPLPADHSFNGRRLRPLIPKPSTCATTNPTLPSCINHGSCDTNNNNDFIPINHHMTTSQSHHHLMGVVEQGGMRDQFSGNQSVVVSSRWNPTPEQLRALEELYRRGTRTPSAVQIQHITSQLRRYGKIEGKNVFYWFQNHKARERQKRRRQQLENSSSPNDQQQSLDHHHDHQAKEPAPGDESNHNYNKGSTKGFEIEQTKAWASPINCSTLADQESVHTPEKAAAECVADDEWVQFQDHHNSLQIASASMFQDSAEEQYRRRRSRLSLLAKNNTTWDSTHHHSTPISSFTKPAPMVNEACENQDHDQGNNKDQGALTLELFPLQSSVAMDLMKDDNDNNDSEDKGTHLASYQFFEFLPLKNSTAY